jgi:hypothetical protein
MPAADYESLIIPALNALASSPDGSMTMTQFIAHLETRQGSTDESASDAQSPESRAFEQRVRAMVSDGDAGSLRGRGLVDTDADGTTVSITPTGRDFIGRR